jgi:hypothetical protein
MPGPPPGAGVFAVPDAVEALVLGAGAAAGDVAGGALVFAGVGAVGVAAVAGADALAAYQVFTPLWPRQAPLLLAPVQ